MNTDKEPGRPENLEALRQRFERWRQSRKPRSRIPAGLWSAAVTLAGAHGMHRTAKTLRLDYYSLKKRVAEHAASDHDSTGDPSAPFWELAPATELEAALPTGHGECVLELEDAGGNRLRVHLRGMATPDLAALSRSFWNPTS